MEWYKIPTPKLHHLEKMSTADFVDIWKNIWFAKGDLQIKMDAYLQKYTPMFSIDMMDAPMPEMDAEYTLLWKVGWLILWDQVSRNVYRGTASAYAFDKRALALANTLLVDWATLPTPIKVSLILVFIHSEDGADLAIVEKLLGDIGGPRGVGSATVMEALSRIAANHKDRMLMFGRIPERNKFLGRVSTAEEIAYMNIFSVV